MGTRRLEVRLALVALLVVLGALLLAGAFAAASAPYRWAGAGPDGWVDGRS